MARSVDKLKVAEAGLTGATFRVLDLSVRRDLPESEHTTYCADAEEIQKRNADKVDQLGGKSDATIAAATSDWHVRHGIDAGR